MPSKQIYGRNNMVMIDQHNKIYGSLGIAEPFVYNTVESNSLLTMSNCREGPFNTARANRLQSRERNCLTKVVALKNV